MKAMGKAYDLVKFPSKVLKTPSVNFTPEEFESGEVLKLGAIMLTKMKEFNGVGLAAPQVGINKKIFVARANGREDIYVNPILYRQGTGTVAVLEGCLSLPGKQYKIRRHKKIALEYFDAHGEIHVEYFEGFDAIVIQHEMDHLNGNLISNKGVYYGSIETDPKTTGSKS